jgi:hypothetical protein
MLCDRAKESEYSVENQKPATDKQKIAKPEVGNPTKGAPEAHDHPRHGEPHRHYKHHDDENPKRWVIHVTPLGLCEVSKRSPDGAQRNPGIPHFASLHAGYGLDILKNGAARGTRTPDPRFTKAVLYQLSYCGSGAFSGEACPGPDPGCEAVRRRKCDNASPYGALITSRAQIRKNRSAGPQSLKYAGNA